MKKTDLRECRMIDQALAQTNKTPQPARLCKYLNSTQQISGPLERKTLVQVRKGSFPYCMPAASDLSRRSCIHALHTIST